MRLRKCPGCVKFLRPSHQGISRFPSLGQPVNSFSPEILRNGSLSLGFPDGSVVKIWPANAEDVNVIPGLGDALEKEMATHPRILAWEIPWTKEPGGLQSLGLKKTWTRLSN